ncbi:hypothetical protein [Haliangium sp.]|uniref:hypothetical protein n=1 Tax=Haliangium sp. TaxID=2663208 RepID=UPI003D1452C8
MTRASHPSPLHPRDGARFLFERDDQSDDLTRASYRASVFTPDQRFDYRVHMSLDGATTSTPTGTPAPEELAAKLATIATLIARAAARKQADELPPWPHRILRWRGPGRG